MSTHTYKKFEDIETGGLPDKMTVFQDCLSTFNASPVDAKKSRSLIAKLLRLLYNGETFPRQEATTLFFSISKLFQHKDSSLRQIVYLAIKELAPISDDILMVTSSIMKDVQNGDVIYKPNAIRTLARILDGSTVHATERLMKTAIVDKHPSVSSAALVASYHLLDVSKDVVKRWTNETQEAVLAVKSYPQTGDRYANDSLITQYHALGLLYELRNHDKVALRKIIQQFSKNLRNPLASTQLIRYVNEILVNDHSLISAFFPLLQDWLTDRHHNINLEAIKVIVALPVTDEQFNAALQRLKFLIGSSKTVSRFAAVRILNRIALKSPERVMSLNSELESLITDPNRGIATYAITTLLKTGSSENIERLIKVISKFINDISDEFKIIIIEAIKTLSLKFPTNYQSMLTFLIEVLNDEGGFEFKNAIVEALFDMIHFVPQSRDLALENLCEFIEDCEFTELSVRILNVLGNEGPKTSNPTLYIRHIYNRVVLENSIIRSAAVIALSKFALINDVEVNKSIKILLRRIVNDSDDEVRDRAIISLKFLEGLDSNKEEVIQLTKPAYSYDLANLEHKLTSYLSKGQDGFITAFDITMVPKITEDELRVIELKQKTSKLDNAVKEPEHNNKHAKSADVKNPHFEESQNADLLKQQYVQELSAIAEFESYGPVLHTSSVVELTDKETEFVISAVKHVFKDHLVLQYNIENTLDDVLLELVSVIAQPEDEGFEEEFILSVDSLTPHGQGTVYVSMSRPSYLQTTNFTNTLSYTSKECDSKTLEALDDQGFEDEYPFEPLSLTPGDFIIPSMVGNFDLIYDEELQTESTATFQVESESIQEVVDQMVQQLNLFPIQGSMVVNDTTHLLKLFGKTIDAERVAAVIKFVHSARNGVTIKATVKVDGEESLAATILEGLV
ncbi:hypothetical protein WICPIJ_003618 [Wickerhamomyces pijperi]|uniref:Coatomer subunit gamma n=1 Tax=Wickerhamomyces pijperi TaxID=599730 RepID=A0A9P8TNQ0_WICPI|nr:hypothetical protein WICPIJ_003618 [Wickerhamomyces pijperi]